MQEIAFLSLRNQAFSSMPRRLDSVNLKSYSYGPGVCFSKLHEKLYYYLLIISMKKLCRANYEVVIKRRNCFTEREFGSKASKLIIAKFL